MTGLVAAESRIPAMTAQAIDKVRELEAITRDLPQVEIATDHVLHGGMYARTICIPAGVVLTGVFIQVPTLLVFDGNATVNAGDDAVTLVGYHVLAASAHRDDLDVGAGEQRSDFAAEGGVTEHECAFNASAEVRVAQQGAVTVHDEASITGAADDLGDERPAAGERESQRRQGQDW